MLACAGLLALAQWSGAGGSRQPSVRVVRITERDFHIGAPRRIAPGRVRLEVANDGPDLHELIVVRDPAGARLPLPPPLHSASASSPAHASMPARSATGR